MPSSQPTLLVTGAAGQLGREVVKHLLAAKTGKIIAATRDTEKLKDIAGVEVRRAAEERALRQNPVGV